MEFALIALVLWVCGRPFRRVDGGEETARQALECGMVLMLMLLLSPMSSKAHFGTLVLLGCCLARATLRARNRLITGILVAAALIGLICNKDPLGERLYTLSLWYGVVTWQTLLMLAACLLAYRQLRKDAAQRNSLGLDPQKRASD
jgi:hypothetical protein